MTAEHDRETLDELLCAAYPDSAGFTVGQVLDVVMPWTAALMAARDEALAKLAEVESRESVERAAIALYEHNRGESYRNDPEFDWPNIDRAYDWDGEEPTPAGDWLRGRIREQARVVIRAALAASPSDRERAHAFEHGVRIDCPGPVSPQSTEEMVRVYRERSKGSATQPSEEPS